MASPDAERGIDRKLEMVDAQTREQPTASHKLAEVKDGSEKGPAQLEHTDAEVRDLGWNEDPEMVPDELISGLPNEDLWTLIRRFNKQMFHVKVVHEAPVSATLHGSESRLFDSWLTPCVQLADLDLEIAKQEVFTPDKFRTHLERFYMTVAVGMFGLWKHVARLRSWRERNRTTAFFVAYTAAWFLGCLIPSFGIVLVVLILHPPARDFLFPHAPPALIDGWTGGVKKPMAAVLGSDSLTGAPESYPGEAVEQEAHSFANSIIEVSHPLQLH